MGSVNGPSVVDASESSVVASRVPAVFCIGVPDIATGASDVAISVAV